MPAAAAAAGLHGRLAVPVGDFVHVLGLPATRLPWLADILPLPGTPLLGIVPSAGDLLLYVGVIAFVAGARAAATDSPKRT